MLSASLMKIRRHQRFYDDHSRLTHAKYNTDERIYDFDYDLAGNRTQQQTTIGITTTTTDWTYNAANQMATMKIGVLYEKLGRKHKKELLRQVVKQVVVNPAGEFMQLELLPPFAYLNDLVLRMDGRVETLEIEKTDNAVGQCSDCVQYSGLYRTRTCNLLDVNETLCQLS